MLLHRIISIPQAAKSQVISFTSYRDSRRALSPTLLGPPPGRCGVLLDRNGFRDVSVLKVSSHRPCAKGMDWRLSSRGCDIEVVTMLSDKALWVVSGLSTASISVYSRIAIDRKNSIHSVSLKGSICPLYSKSAFAYCSRHNTLATL